MTCNERATPADIATRVVAGQDHATEILADLGAVWSEFEIRLAAVPIICRLNEGKLTMTDYRAFLLNLRQQVVDGARWIATAAANISENHLDLRSKFLRHAVTEHRDYEMLEDDYVASGGRLCNIQQAEKNIGSEALSAFMFHRASKTDPFDLLGAMFIIEGLGAFKAAQWACAIRETLGLPDDRPRFLIHHGEHDTGHLDEFRFVLERVGVSPQVRRTIVKTARVVARLYALQLEAIEDPVHVAR